MMNNDASHHADKLGRRIVNRRRRIKDNAKKKREEKDPNRVARGKEVMRKILEGEEKVEFKVQSMVSVVDMANLALSLEQQRDYAALKSITALAKAAFEIASKALEGPLGPQIIDEEEALEVLERMRIIDGNSSSLSMGALRRNRERGVRREIAGTYRGRTNAAGESEQVAAIRMAAEAFQRNNKAAERNPSELFEAPTEEESTIFRTPGETNLEDKEPDSSIE